MMKYSTLTRILTLALVLVFGLTGVSSAAGLGKTYTYDGVFSIQYPSNWEVETDDTENTDTYKFLGMLYAPEDTGLNVEFFMEYYKDWSDISLFSADEATMEVYIAQMLDDYADDEPSYVDTITTTANGIPFIILSCTDDYGPLYYVETMTNGWLIGAYAYAYTDDAYENTRDLTQADYQLLTDMLVTFTAIQ